MFSIFVNKFTLLGGSAFGHSQSAWMGNSTHEENKNINGFPVAKMQHIFS